MPDVKVGATSVSLRPADVVGGGGEADIYRKGATAFKIFKSPHHPDLAGLPDAQTAAQLRIDEQQQKLLAFPKRIPARVIAPQEFVRDGRGKIVGYTMPFLKDAEVLLRYGQRAFRDQGISDEQMVAILIDLYRTVYAVHKGGIVIGDFNDLNVMVKGREAYLIDADSMQFGSYVARSFTTQFVDPLICDPGMSVPVMVRPHTDTTDWYAYLLMLMHTLLFVGPYGGVHRPKDPQQTVPQEGRSLQRISVFHPEVRYPKPARPLSILPDGLLDLLEQTFEKDLRGIPPLNLIEDLRFTTCTKCGAVHARTICPVCVHVTPVMVKEVHTGAVRATKLFAADGVVLYVTVEGGELKYLYHEAGAYKREGGRIVLHDALDPQIRFRINGQKTIFARDHRCMVFAGDPTPEHIAVDSYGGLLPLIDANGERLFYVHNGVLMRTSALGTNYPERVGTVLAQQTLFWVGDSLGFGFYRAAELSNFFVFRPMYAGINDSVRLPAIRGQLIDATCVFSDRRIWFLTATREAGVAINRCYLLDERGQLLGQAEALSGDGSWLGTIRGKTAVGEILLAPTDHGVVRIAAQHSTLSVVKEYPDTQRFVDADTQLFLLKEGLIAVRRHEIWQLVLG